MNDWERRQRLQEALRDAVQDRTPTPAEARTGRRRTRERNPAQTVMMLLAAWAFIAWAWMARPAFLFGPGAPPPPPPEVAEASLRFAMFLEYRRVKAFEVARGRLPTSLGETGPVEADVSYRRVPGGFVISGARGPIALTLTSRMNADSFLGQSLEILQR